MSLNYPDQFVMLLSWPLGWQESQDVQAGVATLSVTIQDCVCSCKLKWMFYYVGREPRKCGRGQVLTRQ